MIVFRPKVYRLLPLGRSLLQFVLSGADFADVGLSSSMTVAHTLSVITFHVIEDKSILEKLHTELKRIMPISKSQPSWNQLEQLPYLVSYLSFSSSITLHIV